VLLAMRGASQAALRVVWGMAFSEVKVKVQVKGKRGGGRGRLIGIATMRQAVSMEGVRGWGLLRPMGLLFEEEFVRRETVGEGELEEEVPVLGLMRVMRRMTWMMKEGSYSVIKKGLRIQRQKRKILRKIIYIRHFLNLPARSISRISFVTNRSLRILVDAFNPIQSARYDLYKRAKLRKETLRRIVNHALSQSVPASVVTTINGFTKVFVGEIIEKARTVQEEWAEAFDRAAYERHLREQADRERQRAGQAAAEVAIVAKQEASPHTNGPSVPTAHQQTNTTNRLKQESPDTIQVPSTLASPSTEKNQTYSLLDGILSFAEVKEDFNPPLSSFQTTQQPSSTQEEFQFPPNPHRGQLLPSHLREALRRCKRDGGDGAGTSGLSLLSLGVRGANTWNAGIGGRKLFR
jgi:histone H3/H4